MLAKFRQRYPQGSLLSELVKIDRGLYIVKVSLQVENVILATALAGADRVETAEDAAIERAIAALVLDVQPTVTNHHETSTTATPTPSIVTPSALSKPVNYSPSPDLTQQQTKITSQPSISTPEIINEPSTPELFVAQANEPEILENSPETSTIPDSGNLFASAYESETLADNTDLDNPPEISPNSLDFPIANTKIENIDFNDIKQKTDIEMKRLGWTKDEGQGFLKAHYGKRTRLHLTDEQLLEFLHHLEKLPTPVK